MATLTNEAFNPLASLEYPPEGNADQLAFPINLEQLDLWVAFRIGRYKFDSQDNDSIIEEGHTIRTIFLPVPQNLGTAYNAQWETEGLGVFGYYGGAAAPDIVDIAQKIGNGTMDVGAALSNFADNIEQSWSQGNLKGGLQSAVLSAIKSDYAAAGGAALGSLIDRGFAGGILGAGAERFVTGAMAGAGKAINPHIAMIFNGVNFRQHSFQYKLVPKNKKESLLLRSIINAFRYAMLPSYIAGNHFFNYPEQFDIDFHYPQFLFNIGRSVLTNFEINYHGENGPFYFDFPEEQTKAPVSVTINMTFVETSILTKDIVETSAFGGDKGMTYESVTGPLSSNDPRLAPFPIRKTQLLPSLEQRRAGG